MDPAADLATAVLTNAWNTAVQAAPIETAAAWTTDPQANVAGTVNAIAAWANNDPNLNPTLNGEAAAATAPEQANPSAWAATTAVVVEAPTALPIVPTTAAEITAPNSAPLLESGIGEVWSVAPTTLAPTTAWQEASPTSAVWETSSALSSIPETSSQQASTSVIESPSPSPSPSPNSTNSASSSTSSTSTSSTFRSTTPTPSTSAPTSSSTTTSLPASTSSSSSLSPGAKGGVILGVLIFVTGLLGLALFLLRRRERLARRRVATTTQRTAGMMEEASPEREREGGWERRLGQVRYRPVPTTMAGGMMGYGEGSSASIVAPLVSPPPAAAGGAGMGGARGGAGGIVPAARPWPTRPTKDAPTMIRLFREIDAMIREHVREFYISDPSSPFESPPQSPSSVYRKPQIPLELEAIFNAHIPGIASILRNAEEDEFTRATALRALASGLILRRLDSGEFYTANGCKRGHLTPEDFDDYSDHDSDAYTASRSNAIFLATESVWDHLRCFFTSNTPAGSRTSDTARRKSIDAIIQRVAAYAADIERCADADYGVEWALVWPLVGGSVNEEVADVVVDVAEGEAGVKRVKGVVCPGLRKGVWEGSEIVVKGKVLIG